MSIANATNYHDLQGLAALRVEARNTPSNAIGEVAVQFESLFMQMMLKSMREATATLEGGLFGSDQMDMYQQMFDQQVSLDMSREGSLGLADILVKQLGGAKTVIEDIESSEPVASLQALKTEFRHEVLPLQHLSIPEKKAGGSAASVVDLASVDVVNQSHNWRPASPKEFIHGVWRHAVEAAQQLNLDPNVLVAQSALETGWGKKTIQSADGSSSFNMFGIKAGDAWRGNFSVVNTVEFRSGIANMEKAIFRVYDSLSNSFSDYVNFLKSNPRYHQALENGSDTPNFLFELQEAGYATDPGYAEKILGIMGTSSFRSVIGELKNLQ